MNKSQKIYFSTGKTGNENKDKFIKVKLEQNVETLEFLSIKLGTKNVYQNFNADYGVLIGRVIANGGVGIPNARISIFIPLTDEDAQDSDIFSIYPYTTPRDKNNDGKRYNLLPRVARKDPADGQISPKQPFGSFPIKEEIVTNVNELNVYKKYYKYTALTNYAGDYMIFGLPIGTQTVHLSVDISDIGKYSMTPAAMVTNLGYSPNLFTDNNSKIKPSTDLNDLPNIETQEITVDVVPFWGDVENFEIGITRQDFRIRSILTNTFTIFGSAFTDADETIWGQDDRTHARRINELNRLRDDAWYNGSVSTKRIGKITEKIYYYPHSISDEDIEAGKVDPINDMLVLDKSEYSAYRRDGDFAFIINCNRSKILTNDAGNNIPIDDNSNDGVFTKFRGFVTIEITMDELQSNAVSEIGSNTRLENIRFKLKFPQGAPRNRTFTREENQNNSEDNNTWRNQTFKFENSKYYSVSRFHGTIYCYNTSKGRTYDDGDMDESNGFWKYDQINKTNDLRHYWNSGILLTGDITNDGELIENDDIGFPSNTVVRGGYKGFGAQWMNLGIYLPQTTVVTDRYSRIKYVRGLSNFTKQIKENKDLNPYYYFDNRQEIVAGDYNTKSFARSDLQWTDIIEVPLADIQKMKESDNKGFTKSELSLTGNTYRNGELTPINPTVNWATPCPLSGGRINGDPTNAPDPETYFFKGMRNANCIDYLYEIGIVS